MVLTAGEIMDADVLLLDADSDVLTCARRMAEHRKGYAVLAGGDHPISGILTEWDILEKVVAAGRDAKEVRASDISSHPVETCSTELPTDEVVERMVRLGIRRLIVTSGDHVVGIITSKTVLAGFRQYVDRITSDIAKNQGNPPLTG